MINAQFRAYEPVVSRQQGADRLVFSEDDLRRALAEIVNGGQIGTIRLGSTIRLTRSIALAGISYGVIIEGGNRYGFTLEKSTGATEFFHIGTRAVSDFTLSGLFFESTFTSVATLPVIFRSTDGNASLTRLVMRNCNLAQATPVFKADTGSMTVADGEFLGNILDISGSGSAKFGTAVYLRCSFLRNYGISSPSLFAPMEAEGAAGSEENSAIATSLKGTHTFAAQLAGGFESFTNDAFRIDKYLALKWQSTTLNSAGPTLDTTGATLHRLTLGASCSGSLTLGAGATDGQLIVLLIVGATGTLTLTDGAAGTRFQGAGNFSCTLNDTVTLVWDETTDKWYEVSRSVN